MRPKPTALSGNFIVTSGKDTPNVPYMAWGNRPKSLYLSCQTFNLLLHIMEKTHCLPAAILSFVLTFPAAAYTHVGAVPENSREISVTQPGMKEDDGRTVSVLQFGARPDDGRDDTAALRKAAEYCREHPGTTLTIPEGVYRLKDKEAEKLEQEVMAGNMGPNPETVIFTPYYPYVRGLDFEGAENVTVRADGAALMCEGWMEAVSIIGCRNFRIEGLTVDYLRKPFSQGTIVEVTPESMLVRFRDGHTLTDATPFPRLMIWDSVKNGMFRDPIYFPEHRLEGDNLVRFMVSIPEYLEWEQAAVPHSFHFRPAIYIGGSSDVEIDNVTIHSQPGMGITGFDSKDITIHGLNVCPADGYSFSTNTDATHFACCEGSLVFDRCFFKGQGDDATNVHGYYHDIASVSEDGWITLELRAPTFTHSQTADVPRIGDTIEITMITTLVPEFTATITDVMHEEKSTIVRIKTDKALPENREDCYIFNTSKLPSMEFSRSIVWGNLSRAVLSKTRNVRIHDNIFRGCTGTAIHVGAESWWKEGGHGINVSITDNVIVNCGDGAGTQYGACGIAVVIDAPETCGTILHDGIEISRNVIRGCPGHEGCGIAVRNARNIRIHDNIIEECAENISTFCTENISIR